MENVASKNKIVLYFSIFLHVSLFFPRTLYRLVKREHELTQVFKT